MDMHGKVSCVLMVRCNSVYLPVPFHSVPDFHSFLAVVRGKWSSFDVKLCRMRYDLAFDRYGKYENCSLSTESEYDSMKLLVSMLLPTIVNVIIDKVPEGGPSKTVLDTVGVACISETVPGVTEAEHENMPTYDVCPAVNDKPLLSDNWSYTIRGVGQLFSGGVKEFRRELIKYSSKAGVLYNFKKNTRTIVSVECWQKHISGCRWMISGSLRAEDGYFEIKKACLAHSCLDVLVNDDTKRLSPKMIGTLIEDEVRMDPTYSATSVKTHMSSSYGFHISYAKAWRSLQVARESIFGGFNESFDQLRWYADVVCKTNPGSIAEVICNTESRKFSRFFIAFKASLDGFMHCRPMIFIDATSLKGKWKGQLLTATAKDGDNGLFPVAMAVVDAETTDNWTYFLSKLKENIRHDKEVFYLSDRNVGLMSAFASVFQRPVHFFCLYHLYTNLKSWYKGQWSNEFRRKMVGLLRRCANAPTVSLFNDHLNVFINTGGSLAKAFIETIPFDKWAVAHAPNIVRYGEMTSNAAESFNNWIKDCRGLPIMYMIDVIRRNIMTWFVDRRADASKWNGFLCKRKEKFWNQCKQQGSSWKIVKAPREGIFEVLAVENFTVDLSKKTCTCYQWQVLGFPCVHAVNVIRTNISHISSIVDRCFFASTYRLAYSLDINPIPSGMKYEFIRTQLDEEKILPPDMHNAPGRPKRKRMQSFGEKLFKKQKPSACPKCGCVGHHDSVTCSNVSQ